MIKFDNWQYMKNWVQSERDNHNRSSQICLKHKRYDESMHHIYMRNSYGKTLVEMLKIEKNGIPTIVFTRIKKDDGDNTSS